jgi:DMSO/TMAO reductase YedYZ molybdopterin-dependent catalytic subunit
MGPKTTRQEPAHGPGTTGPLTDAPGSREAPPDAADYTRDEVQIAFRNREMPIEALAHDITPAGLHYNVVHWDIPDIDPTTWRLRLTGAVRHPLELALDDLRSRPRVTMPVTLECAGNGRGLLPDHPRSVPWLGNAVGTHAWTGVPLATLLAEAGVDEDAVEIVFSGADRGMQGGIDHRYERSLSVADARREEVLVADEMNGQPLSPLHGAPARLVVPGWYGCASVKWLTDVTSVTAPFTGYQQSVAFRYQSSEDNPGTPVTRIRVRALMQPPGIPEFQSRRRFLEPGPVTLTGRAWSGNGEVTRVEVAVDGGPWSEATLGPTVGEHAWRAWRHPWHATTGDHVLTCRATDSTGSVQPLDPPWNVQGMGNNAVQRVEVTVA